MHSILDIISDLKAGKMVIVIDYEDRENEGDIVVAAQLITPEIANFIITHAKGMLCLAISSDISRRLNLELQPTRHTSPDSTAAFTVSADARYGISTGISATDRCQTIRTIVNPHSTVDDITTPGHVFPLIARDGGLRVRQGHTEAAVELMRLANLMPAAAICEILKPNGDAARRDDLLQFAAQHDIKIADIGSILRHLSLQNH